MSNICRYLFLVVGLMLMGMACSAQVQSMEDQAEEKVEFDPLVDNIVEKLPPLQVLIDSAVANSPYIKFEGVDIQLWSHKVLESRRAWTRLMGLDASYRYGSTYVFSTSQTSGGFPSDYTSDQYNWRLGAGIYLKVPFYEIINHRNNVNIAKRELEKRYLRKEQVVRETKQDVIFVYEELLLRQELLKMKNESQLTTTLQVEMAEKEFLNGNITISELSRLTEIHSRNISEFTSQKSLFHRQYLILEELVGIKFNLLSEIN